MYYSHVSAQYICGPTQTISMVNLAFHFPKTCSKSKKIFIVKVMTKLILSVDMSQLTHSCVKLDVDKLIIRTNIICQLEYVSCLQYTIQSSRTSDATEV